MAKKALVSKIRKNETWLARHSSELSINVYPEKTHWPTFSESVAQVRAWLKKSYLNRCCSRTLILPTVWKVTHICELSTSLLNQNTGCTMKFDRIHRNEATSTWPDVHSFWRFDTFELKVFFWFSLRKANHVLRFDNLTIILCSTFWRFDKFGLILARICQIFKTSNKK